MKNLIDYLAIGIAIILAGFTVYSADVRSKTPGEILINETEETEYSDASIMDIQLIEKRTLIATWYGPRFHGKKTANGEVYDEMAFTAAHKQYKFGTLLKVTNPSNGKHVIVRINDRGPYHPIRELDLSKGAAIALGVLEKGVSRLQVEEIAINMDHPVMTVR